MRTNANPFSGLPVVVKNLLIINVIFFLVQSTKLVHLNGLDINDLLGLHYFASPLFKPWQLVTHMFMHGGWIHLGFNMLGLFMLGPPLEYKWGSQRFLTYYMVTGVGAALLYSGVHVFEYTQLAAKLSPETLAQIKLEGHSLWKSRHFYTDPTSNSMNNLLSIPLVGASGAVYGVLLAFGMTFPNMELMVFPIFIPIKAKYFVWILGGLAVFQALDNNPGDNVAHLAHLGGMLVGYLMIRMWRKKNPWE